MVSELDILFVYGTLQSGRQGNVLMRLRRAELLGSAKLDGFALYDLGHYPGIVPLENGTVLGEVWRVDDAALTTLDKYEGSLFSRHIADVDMENGGKAAAYIYVYLGKLEGKERVPLERQPWQAE